MKTIRYSVKFWIHILLATFLFACESMFIPKAPFFVSEIEVCEGCEAKYKYRINSVKDPKRYTQILSDKKYDIGDTLRVINF